MNLLKGRVEAALTGECLKRGGGRHRIPVTVDNNLFIYDVNYDAGTGGVSAELTSHVAGVRTVKALRWIGD